MGTTNPHTGTQTEKNLKAAFAEESEVGSKYTYYASVAKQEGLEQIAALFLQTADYEKEHAKIWFNQLNDMVDIAPNAEEAVDATVDVTTNLAEATDATVDVTANLAETTDAIADVTANLAETVDAIADVVANLAEAADAIGIAENMYASEDIDSVGDASSEGYAWLDIYEGFARSAEEDGFPALAEQFRNVGKIKNHHRERYAHS